MSPLYVILVMNLISRNVAQQDAPRTTLYVGHLAAVVDSNGVFFVGGDLDHAPPIGCNLFIFRNL